MTRVTCRSCGYAFDSNARPGGRTTCRQCKRTVGVPGPSPRRPSTRPTPRRASHPALSYVLALGCGHVRKFKPTPISEEQVFELEWTCGGCGSTGMPAGIVAAITPEQEATLSVEDHAALRARGEELLARLRGGAAAVS